MSLDKSSTYRSQKIESDVQKAMAALTKAILAKARYESSLEEKPKVKELRLELKAARKELNKFKNDNEKRMEALAKLLT